jgi:hypothetical protein
VEWIEHAGSVAAAKRTLRERVKTWAADGRVALLNVDEVRGIREPNSNDRLDVLHFPTGRSASHSVIVGIAARQDAFALALSIVGAERHVSADTEG